MAGLVVEMAVSRASEARFTVLRVVWSEEVLRPAAERRRWRRSDWEIASSRKEVAWRRISEEVTVVMVADVAFGGGDGKGFLQTLDGKEESYGFELGLAFCK